MLYIGHFSFSELGLENEARHGYLWEFPITTVILKN